MNFIVLCCLSAAMNFVVFHYWQNKKTVYQRVFLFSRLFSACTVATTARMNSRARQKADVEKLKTETETFNCFLSRFVEHFSLSHNNNSNFLLLLFWSSTCEKDLKQNIKLLTWSADPKSWKVKNSWKTNFFISQIFTVYQWTK